MNRHPYGVGGRSSWERANQASTSAPRPASAGRGMQNATGIPTAPRRAQHRRPPAPQPVPVDWRGAQGIATDSRRQTLTSTEKLREALRASNCTLTLLDCARWFKNMPNGDLPSTEDLRQLGQQFARIKGNTPAKQLRSCLETGNRGKSSF